jgi:phage shock protein A
MTTITGDTTTTAAERAALLEQLLGDLRAEHAAGPPERAALAHAIATAEGEVARLAAEIERRKAQAKQYKREVDGWKQWYHGQPAISRLPQLAKLQAEIMWRSGAIAGLEAQIGALYTAHSAAHSALEVARRQLDALDAGIYERPISEDPRILDVMAALDAARAAA